MGSRDAAALEARRAAFLAMGEDYDLVRPGYPASALEWLVGREPRQVVDLGCGSGKLTAQLVEAGHSVVGVDPSTSMLARLRTRGLVGVAGTAEAIPLATSCADAVTAAQAFHWFDLPRALPEIHRVLARGGRLCVLWNLRDERVGWVRELSAIVGSEDAMRATMGEEPDALVEMLRRSSLFSGVEQRVFDFTQELTRDRLVALVRSRSYVAILPDDERRAVTGAVQRLCAEHADLAGTRTFVLPYRTLAVRARRQ